MLTLVIKDVAFISKRLDHGARENKTAAYLALNPKGQVPTLARGQIKIRESIAILAWLEREYPSRPIFGRDSRAAAQVWQDIIEWENELPPSVAAIASILLRGPHIERVQDLAAAIEVVSNSADRFEAKLEKAEFLGGEELMANDTWLWPSLEWIARASEKAGDAAPSAVRQLFSSRPALSNWRDRMNGYPGAADTYPPHWRD
jgi:glutathione S-transferase